MYQNDYISAFGKLAPREEWVRETLEKMRAAETAYGEAAYGETAHAETAHGETPGAQPRPRAEAGRRRPASLSVKLRRAALPIAAVVALMAAPLTTLRGCGASGGSASFSMAMAEDAAPQAANEENELISGEPEDGLYGAQTPREAPAGASRDTAGTAKAEYAAPQLPQELLEPGEAGFPFRDEDGGGGGYALCVHTPDAAELAGANPTLDLPAEALPDALPVYRVQDDDAAILSALRKTAEALGDRLKEGSVDIDRVSQKDIAAGAPARSPTAFVHTENGLSLSMQKTQVHFYAYAPDADTLMEFPGGLAGEALCRYYYEHYGARLQPLAYPAYEETGDYNIYKQYLAQTSLYEAGEETDSIAQKLYNYTFRRIELATDEEENLFVVNYTVEPETIGLCPLRTLEEAKQALLASDPDVKILHWELAYYSSMLMDTIQPVYQFIIEDPAQGTPHFEDGDAEDYKYVTYARVPALRAEYLNEMTYQEQYN